MKILHIAECAGGVERYLQMLLPRLEKKGIKQYFICSRNYDESLYSKIVDGVQQMDLTQSFSPLKVIAKVRAIRQEIKRGGQVYFVYNRIESIERMLKRYEKPKEIYDKLQYLIDFAVNYGEK